MPDSDTSANCHGLALSALDRRSIALQLVVSGHEQVLLGRGIYERDEELGGLLRIDMPADTGCQFLICESSWHGTIQSGKSLGCDFLIRLV